MLFACIGIKKKKKKKKKKSVLRQSFHLYLLEKCNCCIIWSSVYQNKLFMLQSYTNYIDFNSSFVFMHFEKKSSTTFKVWADR